MLARHWALRQCGDTEEQAVLWGLVARWERDQTSRRVTPGGGCPGPCRSLAVDVVRGPGGRLRGVKGGAASPGGCRAIGTWRIRRVSGVVWTLLTRETCVPRLAALGVSSVL